MTKYLSSNRNHFYAFLLTIAMLFAGLGNANAQCPAAGYTGSGGPYCVSGSPGFTLQSNASNPNVIKWQYSIDFGSSWVDIPASGTSTYAPATFPGGVYQIIYYQAIIVNCLGFGATPTPSSSPAGPITVVPLPVAGSFSFTSGTNATATTICNGGAATYSLTGANNLLVAPPDIITTTYTVTTNNGSVGGTQVFTRTSTTAGNLVINPTNATASIQSITYTVTATNGTCTPVIIGTVTTCVYPTIIAGSLSSTSVSLCSGQSATLSLPGFTNLVPTGACTGTTYALTTNVGSLSGSCGTITHGIGGAFTTGSAPGTVTITPLNSTNQIQTIRYTATVTNGPCASVPVFVDVAISPNITPAGIAVNTPTPTICTGATATVNITNLLCATGYNSAFTSITVSAPTFGGLGAANMGSGVASAVTKAATSAFFTVSPTISQCAIGTAAYNIFAQNAPCAAPVLIGSISITVYPTIIAPAASVTGTGTICTGASVTSVTTGACGNGYTLSGGFTSYTISVFSAGANITANGLPGTLTNNTGSFTVAPTNLTCNNSANAITYQINAINLATCATAVAGTFTVTVTPSPVVNGQVFSLTDGAITKVCDGASVVITPNNVCAGATYLWERQIDGGGYVFFGNVAGPLSSLAMNSGACIASTYDFRLTVTFGTCSLTANLAPITVYPVITATTAVAPATICSGGSVNFSTSSIGCEQAGATYELLQNGVMVVTNSTSRASFLAAITSYSPPVNYTCANVIYNYSIRVTNNAAGAGCTTTSATTAVTVNPAPSNGAAMAMSVTSTLSICSGNTATITTNRCAATTAGTWLVSINGAGYINIAAAVPAIIMTDNGNGTYTTNGLTTTLCNTITYGFRNTFTSAIGACAVTVNTSNVVTVFPAPITTIPTITASSGTLVAPFFNTDICTAINSVTITSPVPVCGSITTWEYSNNGGASWFAIASSASNTLTLTNVPQNRIYRAIISNGALCATIPSSTVTVTVNVVAGGTPTTATPVICTGSSATITLAGQLGNIIDWQSAPTSAFGAITSLATTANPITVSPIADIWYRAQMASGVCTTFSAPILITVSPATVAGTITGAPAVPSTQCSPASGALTLGGGTVGTVQRWEYSIDAGATWINITNTSTTQNYSGLTQTTQYRALVKSGACADAYSNTVVITVNPAPIATIGAALNTLCVGSSTTLSGTATPVVAGVTLYTITASAGVSPVYASSLIAPTFPLSVTPGVTTTYTYTITTAPCAPVSATTTVTVIPQPTILTFAPVTSPVCATASSVLTFTTGATVAGVSSYKIVSNYPTAGSEVYAANTTAPNSPLTVDPTNVNPNGTTTYTFSITSAPCAATTATTTITVNPVPTVTLTSALSTVCFTSNSTTISGTASPVLAGITTYKVGTTSGGFELYGTTAAGLIAAPTFPLTVTPTSTTTYYYTVMNGACAPVITSTTIVVIPQPTIPTFSSPSPICATSSVALTFSTGATVAGVSSYKITSNYPTAGSEVYAANTTAPTSPLTVDATNVNPNGTTQYTFTVTSAPCGATTSALTVTVHPVPTVTLTGANAAICIGSSTTLSGTSTPVVAGTTAYKIGTTSGGFDIYGTTAAGLVAPPTFPLSVTPAVTTTYYYSVSNGACAPVIASVTVIVIPQPTATISSPSPICATSSTVLTLSTGSTVAGLTSYKIVSSYPTAGSEVYTANTTAPTSPLTVSSTYVNPNGNTTYTFTLTSAPCAATSVSTTVTVHPVPAVTLTGANAAICIGSSTTLSGTSTPVVAATTTYKIGTTSGGFDIYGTTASGLTTAPTFPLSVTPAVTTTYYYSVSNGACAPVIASVTVIVIPQPTATLTSPSPICATSSTVLTFTTGSTVAGLTSYKIVSSYPAAGSEVYAANTTAPTSPLTVDATNVNPNGNTTYTFTLTSAPCAATSVSTTVTVHPVPAVTLTGANASICIGSSTTLSGTSTPVVAATTTYKIGTTSGGFDIYGTTASGLTTAPTFPLSVTPAVTTTYYYSVSNGACAPVIASVTVVVIPQPTATLTSPSPICATTSTVLTFTTGSTVAGLTSYKIVSSYPTAGSEVYAANTTAPTSPLTVSSTYVNPNGNTTYTFTLTSAPCAATSVSTTVTVHPVPTVAVTSANSSICIGSSTTLTGTATPVVAGVTSYIITSSLLGAIYASSFIAPTFPFSVTPAATTTYTYSVMNGACAAVTATVTVVVIPQPTATLTSPSPICATQSTVLTFSTGSTIAGLTTYKITSDYPSAGSAVYATNTAAPSSPLTVNPTNINPNGVTNYTYTVTSAPCGATTASVAVTVHPVPTVTVNAANASICIGSSTTLSGTSTPVVAGTTTYKIGTTSGGFDIYGTTVAGLTTAPTFPFSVTPVATTTYYYSVSNGACAPVVASVTVVVIPQPTATISSPTPICATTSTVLTFSTGSTVAGLTTYKITSSYPSAGSAVYATNTTAPVSPLTVDPTNINPNGTTTYTYTVTSAPCGATTASTSVVVHPVPTVGLTSADASICIGSSTTLTGSSTPVVAGVTTYTLTSNLTGTLYASSFIAPTFPYSVTPAATTTYTYSVQNGACTPVTATVTVVVIPQPTASISSPSPICATTTTVLTFSTGSTVAGLTTYKITSDYPSAGSAVYATNTTAPASPLTVNPTNINPNGVTNYTYTVTSAPCASTTASVAVTVRPVPTALITLAPTTICLNDNTKLYYTIGNVVGGITTYAIGTTPGATNIISTTPIVSSGTFKDSLVVTPPVGITTYYLTVTTGPCTAVSSNASVTVNPTTVGGSLSAGVIICPSSANSNTFSLSGQVGSVVKWQQSTNNGTTWSDISNTLTTYTATNISVSTIYRVVVQSGVCPSQNSATTGIYVNTNPIADFTNTTVCFNTPPTVFSNNTTPGTTITSLLPAPLQALYNIVGGAVSTTTTYAWVFGDPTSASNTSTLTSPSHAYTSAGTYSATLVSTTNTLVGASTVASCSNSVTKSVTVNQVTTSDYTTSPVCFGGASPVNIVNYNSANTYSIIWGDATAAQTPVAATTTRTYTNPGQYSVRLRLTNIYGCSDSITKSVTAWALPVTTGVNITNTAPCVGTSITFTPVGDAGGTTFVINPLTGVATATVANAATISSYAWEFGDGNTANTRIATNTYAAAGTYTVKLTITNSNGCSQLFIFTATPVTVQPLPVASFTNTTVCFGISTTFNSTSTVASGSITGWAWNFGDPSTAGNNTSTSANPTHLYSAPGTYTVNHTVTTAAGCTHTTTVQVTVYPLPLVSFNASALSACAGSTITFNSTSTISSGSFTYDWRVSDNAGNFNFGGGTVSANASLVQTFATAGTYNIRLYAQSANGCRDSATRNVTINANPTAVIVVNPASNQICIYEAFTFTSTGSLAGSGTISSYAWTFGDGSTSTAANPAAKSYASPGTYTVGLVITNSNGCTNTTSKVVIVNPKPVVNFTSSNVCYGYTMNFTDASTTGVGTTYLWNFGDLASGALNTATTQNTSHDFTTAGTFTVKLIVTNGSGCKDSLSKLVTVWPRPVADFKADTVCEGGVTSFTNLSTIASGSMSFLWNFGDAANTTSIASDPTFMYTPGVYSVKLIVTSGFGCIDSVRKLILVKANPKPIFVAANACLRDAITLDTTGSNGSATVTLLVDYGDGSAPTASLTHTYTMSGVYTVTLTMLDNGCTSTISKVVTIFDLPLPSFSVSAYTICVNAVDTFSNTSSIASGTIVSNKWEVINASNTVVAAVTYSANQEFIYAFNTAGIYRVKLTATSNNGCVDTVSKTVTVNALPTVAINSINFLVQAFHACLGTPHQLTSTGSTAGSGTIASYYWDFGDGNTSSSQNPIYAYKAVGTYTVTLVITNSNGCTFSKTQSVVVDPIPDATIRPSNFPIQTCNGTPFTFTGPSGAGYNYVWTRNGVVLGTTQVLTVNPPTSGWYYLAVTSSFGCTKVDSAYLTVNPLPVIILSDKHPIISKGWNKQINAAVTGPNPTFTYLWTAQDASIKTIISNNAIPNPVLTPPNDVLSYYFVVTVTDQKGCIQRDTVYFTMLEDYNLKPTNLMTPNGDGKNDIFWIENIDTYTDADVTIFNRWGNVVYQTTDYAKQPWNGTFNNTGGELPDGTYYYIIRTVYKVDGKDLIYKGHITILRGR